MAGPRIVGKVGIKAIPDVRGFNKTLTERLEGVAEKSILIPVELEEKSFTRMRERIEKQAEKMKIRLKPELADEELKADIKKIEKENKAKVKTEVDLDEENLRRNERIIKDSFDKIELMNRELARKMERDAARGTFIDQEYANRVRDQFNDLVARLQDEAEVKFELELEPENIELVKAQMDNLIQQYEDRNIPLEAVVENFWASRNLNWITRPRTVEIFTKLNAQSAAATSAAIAALSGARLAGNVSSDMWDFFKDLDKNLPMLSAASTTLINLSGTLFGVTSSLVSFGAGLAHITPLLLTLPGFLMGGVAAVVAFGVAWADVKTELASLEEPFANLQNIMSAAYWSEAKGPITEFITGLMPQMERSLGSASRALGGFTGALATSFGKEFANGRFESIFATFEEGFRVLEQGTDGFAGAVVNMAQIAGMYWPRLAGWINDTAGRFDQWLTDISTDGRLSDWMERGITSLYDLWGGIEAGGRILRGLWTAANNAGADAMAGFREQMEAWDELVNRPSSQSALRDWFEGGREAAAGLGDAVENIFAPFARNSNLVKETFIASGDAIRAFGTVIGNIFGHSSSISGFTSGLESIEQAFVRIEGSAGSLGVFLGETAEFTGEFARILAGPLGTALDVILPRAGEVLSEVLRVSEVLAGAFDEVLSSPEFRGLADDFVVLATALADAAIALAPFATGVLQGAVDLFDALGPAGIIAAGGIVAIGNAAVVASAAIPRFMDAFKLFTPAGTTIRGALGGVTAFLGAPWLVPVAAAGAALVVFADYVESTRATVDELEASLRGGASAAELLSESQTILQGFDLDSGKYFMVDGAMEYVSWLDKIPDLLDDINASNADGIFGGLHGVDFELAFSGFEEAISGYDDLLSQMDFEGASSGFVRLADDMGLSRDQARELLDLMPGVEESLIRYANQHDIALDTVDGVVDANQLLGIAYREIGPAADEAAAGVLSASEAAEAAAARTQALIDRQSELYNQWAASKDANLAWHEAITANTDDLARLDAALAGNRDSLDLNTAAGQEAERMLLDTIAAHNARYQAALDDGASQETLAGIVADSRVELGRQMDAFGLTREGARQYNDELSRIPQSVHTAMILNTSAAERSLYTFINKKRSLIIDVDVVTGAGMPSVGFGDIVGYSDGGLIPGAASTSDNRLAAVASGEFIVNTRQTQKHLPLLRALNDGDDLSGFIGGGQQPLVGSLTMVSSGDTREDIDDVMFRLRSIGRGGR